MDTNTASDGHLWTSTLDHTADICDNISYDNHRLRGAMLNAEMTAPALAALVEVDVKSVMRWITEDRIPYPATRIKVARALQQEETFLWSALLEAPDACAVAAAEVERIWPTRSAISTETW